MMNILEISTVDAKKVLASLEEEDVFPGQKRRRLENLSTEERTLRRKLKNRVAAQTARDRKKAHMEELEVAVTRFETENKLLKQSNEELRSQVHSLLDENQQLRIKLGLTPPVSPSSDYTCLTAPRTASIIQEIIITPSVDDHANLVIKKEELSIVEHASLYNACTQRWTLYATILLSLVTTLVFRIQSADTDGAAFLDDVEIDVVGDDSLPASPSTDMVSVKSEEVDSDGRETKCDSLYGFGIGDDEAVFSERSRGFRPTSSQPLSPASSLNDDDIDQLLNLYEASTPGHSFHVGLGPRLTGDYRNYASESDEASQSSDDVSINDSVDFEDPFGSLFPALL